MLREWDEIPDFMKISVVRPYYEALYKKRWQLKIKRFFDFTVALIMLVILTVPMFVIAIMIKLDSRGSVFYRQERVTAYGKHYRIHKFRTMVSNADKIGTAITTENDTRITKIGTVLRNYRLDELPQLFDILSGNMSFVGTRPEIVKYVERYQPVYFATLLLPAGITSEASIRYKEEDKLLNEADNIDEVYIKKILPEKMKWNLKSIRNYSFAGDLLTMFRTVSAVLGKDYK